MIKLNKTTKRILLIRARYTEPSIRKVAKSLHQEGYDVTLLIWDRSGKRTLSVEKNEYKIDYFCLRAPQDKRSAVFFLPIWWVYELFYLLKKNPDIIHACDFETQYPAIIVKIVRKKYFVYMIYDFYANNLPNGKFPLVRNAIRSLVANIEKIGIGFADLLILVDESRYEEVKGAKIKKSICVCGAPEEVIEQKNRNFGKICDTQIIIFYAGIIEKTRGISYVITAIENTKDVVLILAGPEVDKEILVGRLNEKVKYVGWIPTYEELIAKTKNADILFRFDDPNYPRSKYATATKLFEAMMCGKPIIVSDNSTMADIVRQNNCGLVVPYGDVELIKHAILTLKNNPELRKQLGANGRSAYEEKYSWEKMEERLISAYEVLLSE